MARHWSDDAIETLEQDEFGRSKYARHAAALIATTHSWDGSTVFGLTGAWGSGKTSLLNMIIDALREGEMEQGGTKHSVVRFTPWATHDVAGVLSDFYASLVEALPKRRRRDARKAFGSLLRVAAPAAQLIPVGGGMAAGFAEMAAARLTQAEPWDVEFGNAAKMLRDNKIPILIVVDDIDRLQGDELLAVLKVIRLLGRFPGVQYLLAYDEISLSHTLEAVHAASDEGAARRYIEKIVQYPISVPPLLEAQLDRRLFAGLTEIVKSHRPGEDVPQTRRLGEKEVTSAMRATLITPRAIDRYLAQVDYELGLHKRGEIDDQDVIILALLRTAFPSVYSALPGHQDELITGNTDNLSAGELGFVEFNVEPLIENVLPAEQKHAEQLLHTLFPKLVNTSASPARMRVCTPEYFGRYFAMGVLAEHDIADADVRAAVLTAISGDGSALVSMLKTPDADLADLALAKTTNCFQTHWHQTAEEKQDAVTLALLRVLLPVVDDLDNSGFFTFTVYDRIIRWIGRDVLPLVSDNVEVAQLISALGLIQSPDTHVFILHQVEQLHTARATAPDWWRPVVKAALPVVADAFLDYLRERDQAPRERSILTAFFHTAEAAGAPLDGLRDAITEGIKRDQFSIDDLASRYVYTTVVGGLDVNQDGFNRVAPDINTEWYDADPVDDIDEYNSTWENRRRFAAGRIGRPPNVQ